MSTRTKKSSTPPVEAVEPEVSVEPVEPEVEPKVEPVVEPSAEPQETPGVQAPVIPDHLRCASDDRALEAAALELAARRQMGENVIHCRVCGVIPVGTCPYNGAPGAPCQQKG
jgi:hypothetical protein